MKKAIVYSTTTGNTEKMAEAVKSGAEKSGAEVIYTTADSADADAVLGCDQIFLGSPAMGDEVLEDSMETFFAAIEGKISGKKIGIFGSYDWGDGQWLRDWADRITNQGAVMLNGEGLKGHLEPDADVISECEALGSTN